MDLYRTEAHRKKGKAEIEKNIEFFEIIGNND